MPLSDSLRIRLSPPRQTIEHGAWSVQLATDELVDLRWHDRVILRGIRAAIRDQDWRTLSPTVTAVGDVETPSERAVRLEIDYAGWGQTYSAVVSLRLSDTAVTVEFDGHADAPFLGNRIGLVVLHEPSNAGEAVVLATPDGVQTASKFPIEIQPHQPFKNIAGMRWTHDGARIDLRFTGDTFETEDQRNWTDASYKTYSTPLDLPYPVEHAAGSVVRQSLTVTVEPDATFSEREPERSTACEIVISDDVVGRVPALGVSAGTDPAVAELEAADSAATNSAGADAMATDPASAGTGSAPTAPAGSGSESTSRPITGLDAVLVELTGSSDQRRRVLADARREATRLGAPLDVRIVAENPAELVATLDLLDNADVWCSGLARIGVFHPLSHVTEPELWAALNAETQDRGFTGTLLAGARSHFTELNRTSQQLPSDADAVVFSMTPQMHAEEVERVVQTLPMHRLVAENALRLGDGRQLHIGPITLKPRFNAVATRGGYDEATRLAMITDDLQSSQFAAAWTLGSIAALTGVGGAEGGLIASVSYFETRGARGIDAADGTPHPVGRLIRALAALRGRPVLQATEMRRFGRDAPGQRDISSETAHLDNDHANGDVTRAKSSDPSIVVYPVLGDPVPDGSRLVIFVGNLTGDPRPLTLRVGADALQLELEPWAMQTLTAALPQHATKGTPS